MIKCLYLKLKVKMFESPYKFLSLFFFLLEFQNTSLALELVTNLGLHQIP
jgi:hypothetical protein